MNYLLLEQAPKDHLSKEFLDFLAEKNVVVHDLDSWLVIENCKYHQKEGNKSWWTAFIKRECPHQSWITGTEWTELFEYMPMTWKVEIKRSEDRTVKRFHVHFIE